MVYNYGYDVSPYARGYASNSSIATGIGAALGAFFGIVLVAMLALAIIQVVAMWKIFTKAGEKGWKAIIPFYNFAILYKISGMSPYLALVFIGLVIPFVNIFVAIAFSVFNLYQTINLAKGFNKSTGFTVGMIMVPFIFYLILGFGKSEYVGFSTTSSVDQV